MSRMIAMAAGALALAAATQGGEPARAQAAPAKSLYRAQVAPLLASQCATCHLTGAEAGNMALVPNKAIASLVNVKATGAPALARVVPGKPDQSYLVMKLEGTQVRHGGTGARMPFGAGPLAPEKIALIRRWIAEGAKP